MQSEKLKKKLNKNFFKNGQVIVQNCEVWGNKGDGLKIKLLKTFLINCKIRQNVAGAISIENEQTESVFSIHSNNAKYTDIKGKIYSEKGLLYPKIMIQDDLIAVAHQIRKQSLLTLM